MRNLTKNAARLQKIFAEKGISGISRHSRVKLFALREQANYKKWIRRHTLNAEKRAEIAAKIEAFRHRPLISVVMPVYDVAEKWLRLCIESVIGQIYENWEFCIADDCSPSPHIRKVLEEYAARDARFKIVFRAVNSHISAASNSALELAAGEFCVLLDHDDELAPDALFCVAQEINNFPAVKFIYSDEDLIDERGRRSEPKFKPDFSLDLLCSLNIITHLSAYETALLRKIGGFRSGMEGSQDYDLALRVVERISENEIRHIPRVLYHWRAVKGSVALDSEEKPYARERAREAIRQHFARLGKDVSVECAVVNSHRVRYRLSAAPPRVSLILAIGESEKATEKSLTNFVETTAYENLEIIVTGGAQSRLTEKTFLNSAIKITFITHHGGAAERLNFAAEAADGEILCFADANLKPSGNDWLDELTGFAVQPEIGAVGAKILDKNKNILHGGLIVGTAETVSSAHRNFPTEISGNLLRAQLIGNFSAVSAACLAVRREVFVSAGGFDAVNLPETLFDVDFCLKLRERQYRIVFTPYAELVKIDRKINLLFEKKIADDERKYFEQRWREVFERDEFYNPNLSKKQADFSIDS